MRTLPTEREMYAALLRRDAEYEGVFLAGVRTTGIFCRPTCPARKPRREHVDFFADAAAARRAGLRPCLRCRPLEAPGSPPEWMERVVAAVERAGGARIGDGDLRALGLEPARVRRGFRQRYGMTFHAWQRARRLGLAQASLSAGESPDQAGFGAGYGSASGFREAFARLFGAPPASAREREPLRGAVIASPLGALVAVASARGLCLLEFADRRGLAGQARALGRWHTGPVVPGESEHLARLEAQLGEYFDGCRKTFDVALDLAGPPFHLAVWKRLLALPFGETISYGALARELGRAGAQRAVARANGMNRIAILVPCHRVVGAGGELTGYGGGLWRKRALLEHERAVAAACTSAGAGSAPGA
jgi:AraC family transcriptional regulator of adaptative response/methylated-DNA-[protein]-cysteine methyltransferase